MTVRNKKHLRFRVVLEKNELGGFTATVPALPPVVSQGDTFEESLENVKEAIELYIDYLKDRGEKVPLESEIAVCDVEVNS